jgi:hypothetical protein
MNQAPVVGLVLLYGGSGNARIISQGPNAIPCPNPGQALLLAGGQILQFLT